MYKDMRVTKLTAGKPPPLPIDGYYNLSTIKVTSTPISSHCLNKPLNG